MKINNSDLFLKPTDSSIIHPSDLFFIEQEFGSDILYLIQEISKLPVIESETLNVVDLDDTIYSRFNQLQNPLLNENRGVAGNKVIEDLMGGYEKFCEMMYTPDQAVGDFVDLVKNTNSLILTAGIEKFQTLKLDNIGGGLNLEQKVVVDKDYKKPAYLLMYIIFKLGYIPGSINVYDDRVKYFKEHAPSIAKLLKTNININEVVLSEQSTNRIESINQSSYNQSKLEI